MNSYIYYSDLLLWFGFTDGEFKHQWWGNPTPLEVTCMIYWQEGVGWLGKFYHLSLCVWATEIWANDSHNDEIWWITFFSWTVGNFLYVSVVFTEKVRRKQKEKILIIQVKVQHLQLFISFLSECVWNSLSWKNSLAVTSRKHELHRFIIRIKKGKSRCQNIILTFMKLKKLFGFIFPNLSNSL